MKNDNSHNIMATGVVISVAIAAIITSMYQGKSTQNTLLVNQLTPQYPTHKFNSITIDAYMQFFFVFNLLNVYISFV